MKEIELKLQGKIQRLTNKTFKFDERVGEGWFSAVYFLKTRDIIRKYKPDNIVTMQFFFKRSMPYFVVRMKPLRLFKRSLIIQKS